MAAVDTQNETLAWRVHPARERPAAAVFALLIVGGMIWMVAVIMQAPWWGLLPAVFFLFTLQRFFLSSEYRIDRNGVTAKTAFGSQTYRWPDIRRFRHDEGGAFLSDRRRASLLDTFRGMHLMFAGNREQVVQRIEAGMKVDS